MSENAAMDARKRFDLKRQANDYLEWYKTIYNQLKLTIPKRDGLKGD